MVNQIEHCCITKRWATSLMDPRSYRGADFASDHSLVVAKLKMKLKKQGTAHKNRIKAYDVEKLKQSEIQDLYNLEVKNRFQALVDIEWPECCSECVEHEHVEPKWEDLKIVINSVAEEVVECRRGTKRDRQIYEDTWKTIDERRYIKMKKEQYALSTEELENQQDEYRKKDKEVKQNQEIRRCCTEL